MVSAEGYITDGPDLTHLLGKRKKEIGCMGLSYALPEVIFDTDEAFQRLTEQHNLGVSVDAAYLGKRPFALQPKTLFKSPARS
eukprot:10243888-Karenia_brevis.AAC.1